MRFKKLVGGTTSSTLELVSLYLLLNDSDARALTPTILAVVFYLAMAFIYFRETTNMTAEEVGLLFDHDDAAIVQHLAEGKHEISHVEKVGEDSA